MQKGKMAIGGGLTNSWERREAKGKREKERYTHLNAEFQRIARWPTTLVLKPLSWMTLAYFWYGKERDVATPMPISLMIWPREKCRCLKWSPISDILEVLSPPVELASEEVNNSCQFLSFLYGSLCAGPHLSKTNLLIRMLISDKVLRSQ